MSERIYNIAKISQKLKIPENKARFYCEKISTLKSSVGTTHNKTDNTAHKDVLRIIAEGLRGRLTATQITEQLCNEFFILSKNTKTLQQQTVEVTENPLKESPTELETYALKNQRILMDQQAEIGELKYKYEAQGEFLGEMLEGQQEEIRQLRNLIQQLQEKNLQLSEEQIATREEITDVKDTITESGKSRLKRKQEAKSFWQKLFH
jgi:thymidylate synthase